MRGRRVNLPVVNSTGEEAWAPSASVGFVASALFILVRSRRSSVALGVLGAPGQLDIALQFEFQQRQIQSGNQLLSLV